MELDERRQIGKKTIIGIRGRQRKGYKTQVEGSREGRGLEAKCFLN